MFRPAVEEDAAILAALRVRQLVDEGEEPTGGALQSMREYFAQALRDGSFACWVAEDEGRVVATAGVVFYRLPPTFTNPSGWTAYVTNVFTEREHRKQGVATRLLRLALRAVDERCVAVARLHASEEGKSIYRRAGFSDSEGYMALRLNEDWRRRFAGEDEEEQA